MTNAVEIPWGTSTLAVALPSGWKLLGELRPRGEPALDVPATACAEALAAPIDAAPLRGRDLAHAKVVVVVDDHTRPTPVREFLPAVLAALNAAGARDESVEILLANGVHRPSRADEVERKLGPQAMKHYRWRCHDAYAAEGLADMGTTSRGTRVRLARTLVNADLIVCLGAVEPHLLLGFGGGLKMIIPGCAAADTIGRNHMQGVDPDHFDYVGAAAEASPMRLDLEEGARLLKGDIFIVNAAINEHGRPTRFFCGDPVAAHRAAVAFVERFARIEVPERADVVIANSYPMDADLRQSVKCLGNSLDACKPGGVMMGLVRCEHGLGEMPIPKKTLPNSLLRTLVRVIGKQRILGFVERVKKGEPVEEVFVGHFGLQMLRRNHLGLYSKNLPADLDRRIGLARIFADVDAFVQWGAARAPRNASVWLFPCGGVTYAAQARAA
jgi:nickel-dependent lactate racemase